MDGNASDKLPRDVHELLLTGEEEEGKDRIEEHEVLDARRPKGPFFTIPVIVILVVAALSVIGVGIIFSNDILREQFQAMLSGDLGKYKEQLRKAKEDKVREIENLTGNKYGSLALFYSPRDAKVTIQEKKYKLDCSAEKEDVALATCLKKKIDYAQKPEEKAIDNPSLHLDRAKKEIIEQIPLNDIPIQEASDDRKIIYRYEYAIQIEADGYYPRQFYLTGDKEHGPTSKDVEALYWDQKGPGVFMANFGGADLLPKPETAKEHYKKARIDMACIDKEVAAKKKEGKNVSQDTVSGLYIEILNRHGFKTFEEFDRIDGELKKDEAFIKAFDKELAKAPCG